MAARRLLPLAAALAACGEAAPPGPQTLAGDWPVSVELPGGAHPPYERVVLVTIDTLRADHVSAYGYRRETTPTFDRLAERGVLFTHANAVISHTAPSHSSMLTGLPPLVHGVLHNGYEMDPDALDLARVFAAAGYETAACVNTEFLQGVARSFQTVHATTERGEAVVAQARAWLRDERRTPRFFLWVHLFDPHRWKDLAVEVGGARLWRGQTPEGWEDYVLALHGLTRMGREGLLAQRWETVAGKPIELASVEQYLRFVDGYDRLIQYADQQLGELYEAVQALALAGPTLWVVTADHGEGLASHGTDGHGAHIYQEQLAVPLLFHASDGGLAARRVDALTSHLDLYPTLVAMLGGTVRAEAGLVEGRSLWPLLRGEPVAWPERALFAQRKPTTEELYALVGERYKLLAGAQGAEELYDLAGDPHELDNVVESAPDERTRLVQELERRLALFRARAQGSGDQAIPEEWMGELRDLGYVR